MKVTTFLKNLCVERRAILAEKCGVKDKYLYQISTGYRSCGPALAVEIEKHTDGLIRAEDCAPGVDWGYIRRQGEASS